MGSGSLKLTGCLIVVMVLIVVAARTVGGSQRGGSQLAVSVFQNGRSPSYVVLADTQRHTLVRLYKPGQTVYPLMWLDTNHLLLALDEMPRRLVPEYAIYALGSGTLRFSEPSACARHTLAGRGRYLTCIGSERRAFMVYYRADVAAGQTATPQAFRSDSPIYSYVLSADGRRAALSTRENGFTEIWLLDMDSGHIQMLDRVELVSTPSWSRDGSLLAYLTQNGSGTAVRIYRIQDGALLLRTDLGAEYTGGVLAWEDNSALTLYLRRGARADLWLLQMGDYGVHQLQDDLEAEGLPVWSPDGTQLAFFDSTRYTLTLRSRLHSLEGYRLPANLTAESPARWRPCQETGC
jgi:hypothetical protein